MLGLSVWASCCTYVSAEKQVGLVASQLYTPAGQVAPVCGGVSCRSHYATTRNLDPLPRQLEHVYISSLYSPSYKDALVDINC